MDTKSQSRLQGLSKWIALFARLGQIFLAIIAGFIVISALAVPFVQKQIKIDGHVITAFGQKFELEKRENTLVIKTGDDEKVIEDLNSQTIDMIMDAINDNNVRKFAISLEVALLFAGLQLIFTVLAFGSVRKVFKAIQTGDTPFTSDNASYLRRVGNYLVAIIITGFVSSIVTSIIIGADLSLNIKGASIMTILITFAASYVVEYGVVLQAKSKKTTIYGTESE